MKFVSFAIAFVLLLSMELKTTHKSLSQREKYLRELPDKIIKDLHDQMKTVMEKRAFRYPDAKNIKHVNLDRTLAVQPSHTTFGFKWTAKNKFMRTYDQKDWIFEHKMKNTNTMTKNPKYISHAVLHRRWARRKDNKKQMQCMLYGKIYAIEKIMQISVMLVKVKFRSPCMDTTITKVFIVNNQSVLPVVFKVTIGPELFVFEFNNALDKSGYGINKREIYRSYRLLNFYYAATNPIFMKKNKQSAGQIISSQTRKLKSQEPYIEDPKEEPLKEEKFDRKLYKESKHNHIPFKSSGNDYIVLGSKNNLKPYFTFEDITNLWNGSNSVYCSFFNDSTKTTRIRRSFNYWYFNIWYRRWYYSTYTYYIVISTDAKGMDCRT